MSGRGISCGYGILQLSPQPGSCLNQAGTRLRGFQVQASQSVRPVHDVHSSQRERGALHSAMPVFLKLTGLTVCHYLRDVLLDSVTLVLTDGILNRPRKLKKVFPFLPFASSQSLCLSSLLLLRLRPVSTHAHA